MDEISALVLSKDASKVKRSRSASTNGDLNKSNSNINNNGSSDNIVNNNSNQADTSGVASPRNKLRNSALISPKRLNESDKEKKPKRDHRHSMHEHRSTSPKTKKEVPKKEKAIPDEKVRLPKKKIIYFDFNLRKIKHK